jgi:hypothetical protein
MCQAVHVEEYGLGADDLLFPQWMFAYVHSIPVAADDDENPPPLVSRTGIIHEHGTKGAPIHDELPLQEVKRVRTRIPAPVALPAERRKSPHG